MGRTLESRRGSRCPPLCWVSASRGFPPICLAGVARGRAALAVPLRTGPDALDGTGAPGHVASPREGEQALSAAGVCAVSPSCPVS